MKPLGWKPRAAVVALVALSLVGTKLYHTHSTKLSAARQEAKAAVTQARRLQFAAANHAANAAASYAAAAALKPAYATKKAAFEQAAADAPEPCTPVIVAARDAIQTADVITAKTDVAYAEQKQATAALNTAVDALVPATEKLVTASRPSFLGIPLPKVGFGVAAGVNPQGKPDAVAGVTFSWSY